MAEKVRCISNAILNNDNFITLPASAKILYVYINNETDDAGFCDHVNAIMRTLSSRKNDLTLLIERGYLYEVCKGWLYLEKHFFINNRGLRRDRLKVSRFAEYLNAYVLKDNGAYTTVEKWHQNGGKLQPNVDKLTSSCRQNDTIREEKIREEKIREENIRELNIRELNIRQEKAKAAVCEVFKNQLTDALEVEQ